MPQGLRPISGRNISLERAVKRLKYGSQTLEGQEAVLCGQNSRDSKSRFQSLKRFLLHQKQLSVFYMLVPELVASVEWGVRSKVLSFILQWE